MRRKKDKQALRNIDAPHYNVWQALYRSFYSARLYIDVYRRWKGLAVGYLLIMLLLFTLPISITSIIDFDRFFMRNIYNPIKSIPAIQIENGVVRFDKPMPWKKKNAAGEVSLIIDTTGEIDTFDLQQYPDLRVLILENSLSLYFPLYKEIPGIPAMEQKPAVRKLIFPPDANGTLTGEFFIKQFGLNIFRWSAVAIIWPVYTVFVFTLCIGLLWALAMMGQVIAQTILKFRLRYLESFRLLTVAATPSLFLILLSLASGVWGQITGVLIVVLTPLYFSYGVLAIRRASKKMVRQ